MILPAVLALAVGLGAGRFTGYSSEPSAPPAPAAAATPTDQIATLERATAERPNDPAGFQALGTAYVHQAATTGDPAFYDLARRALDQAAALDPGAAPTLVAQGVLALSLHEFAEAERLATRVLADEPINPDALAVLVDAQVELGRYDEAAFTLQSLLDVRPDLPALARTSYLRQLAGDLDGALTAARQARAAGAGLTAATAQVATIEGEIQLRRGDPEAAAAAFDEAVRLLPELAAAELGRAQALVALDQPDEAIDVLEPLLDRQPTPAAAILLGELQAAAGRSAEAERSFGLAAAMYDLQAGAGQVVDLEAAWFQADHGDPLDAVATAQAAYDARRTVFTADALAWALHRAGRSDEAVPFAEEALAGGIAEPSVRVHSAAALVAAGRPDAAREALLPAVERGGWLSPTLEPIARALTTELELPLPETWR